MKLYINNVQQEIQILPLNVPTLDESLETLSFGLVVNNNDTPFAPMQEVRLELENDSNDILYFVLTTDEVELYSLNPLKYKHNITCVQNTRILSKRLVRNTVLTQPAQPIKKGFNATSSVITTTGWSDISANKYMEVHEWAGSSQRGTLNQASEPLPISSREKCSKSTFRIGLQVAVCRQNGGDARKNATWYNDVKTYDELENLISVGDFNYLGYFDLRYDLDGITQTETIMPAQLGLTNNEFLFNTDIDYPFIRDIINQGATNIEILFPPTIVQPFIAINNMDPANEDFVFFYAMQLEIKAETYYYSAYDILEKLIQRQKKTFNSHELTVPFTLPAQDTELYNLLTKTVAPNFTFTQMTLYECVAEVFKLFDAIFTMDGNGELGIEYFNNLDGEVLSSPSFTGKKKSIGEDKYTNGLVSYYQDARLKETFPSGNNFAPARSAEFGVPAAQDHHFITPHPIQSVSKVEVLIKEMSFLYFTNAETVINSPMTLDVTRYVVNRNVWSVLATDVNLNTNPATLKQINTVYFEEGDNKIQLAYSKNLSWGYLGYAFQNMLKCAIFRDFGWRNISNNQFLTIYDPAQGVWKDIKMRATYMSTINGVAKVESITNKTDGELIIDQSSGAVDLNKLGLNLLGTSFKIGEPTLDASFKITTWDNRIKTGSIYKEGNNTWIANVCSYTFLDENHLKQTVSFVKNFNALSMRTKLLREKRMTNISANLTAKSEDILTEYVYFSSSTITGTNENIAFKQTFLLNAFTNTFAYTNVVIGIGISYVYVNGMYIYIPLSKYGFGNTICFEMSFDNNMNAGNQTYITGANWLGQDKYFTQAVVYTDDEGFLDTIDIEMEGGINYTDQIEFDDKFPKLTTVPNDYVMQISDYYVYKQPNEIFALNYQLAFLPINENIDFIGQKFINENYLITGKKAEATKELYLYYSNDYVYSNLDLYGQGSRVKINNVSYSGRVMIFQHSSVSTLKSWAICDKDGNIYFASNNEFAGTNTTKSIYLLFHKTRLY